MIQWEVLKDRGSCLMEYLHFCTMWEQKTVIQDFRDALVVHIYKRKGDRAVCDNHRGTVYRSISLISIAGKVLARVLLNDIIPECQCGFRSVRCTTDKIFTTRKVLWTARWLTHFVHRPHKGVWLCQQVRPMVSPHENELPTEVRKHNLLIARRHDGTSDRWWGDISGIRHHKQNQTRLCSRPDVVLHFLRHNATDGFQRLWCRNSSPHLHRWQRFQPSQTSSSHQNLCYCDIRMIVLSLLTLRLTLNFYLITSSKLHPWRRQRLWCRNVGFDTIWYHIHGPASQVLHSCYHNQRQQTHFSI